MKPTHNDELIVAIREGTVTLLTSAVTAKLENRTCRKLIDALEMFSADNSNNQKSEICPGLELRCFRSYIEFAFTLYLPSEIQHIQYMVERTNINSLLHILTRKYAEAYGHIIAPPTVS